MRGAAALLVVLSHARLYFYLESGVPSGGRSTVEKVLLVPTSFGRESVAVFFVLSGYFVGGQVLRQIRRGTFSPSEFAAKRFSRLWLVLVPGLACTAILDAVSRSLWTANGAYQGDGRSNVSTALCNAAFLMDGRCSPFGTNESLWSLGYEFWFYIVFAAVTAAAYAMRRRKPTAVAVGLLVTAVAVAAFGPVLLTLIPAWLIGVVVAEATARMDGWTPRNPALAGGLALALVGLFASYALDTGLAVKYLMLGIAFAPLIGMLALRDLSAPAALASLERLGVWLGGWSFTLYVFHLPVLMLLAVAAVAGGVPANPATAYLLAAVVVVLTRPAFWLGEAHTIPVRKALLARISRRRGVRSDEAA
jgi:peptidoglycan/LPS O-acetylase OafA/YrhL